MKPKLSGSRGFLLFGGLRIIFLTALLCSKADRLIAMPRSPGPPVPELAPLYSEGFDEDYFFGETNTQLTIPDFGWLDESWSGYSLARAGENVSPFIVPAINATGETNLSCDTGGALRFWVRPYWTSQSLTNNGGPGAIAILLELDAAGNGEVTGAWSLQVSADGNTLSLVTPTGTAIQTPIAWMAGESHNIVLNYSSEGTAISIDDGEFAYGSGVTSIPCTSGQLVIGSAYSGANPADADIEEFYSFGHFLKAADVALYYSFTAGEAAKGPMPGDQINHFHRHRGAMMMEADLTPIYNPDTGCVTGGQPYFTSVSSAPATNGTRNFTFSIRGGTNNVIYDIYGTSVITNSLARHQWDWVGQGMTCSTYTLSNQPPDISFYVMTTPANTMAITFGNTRFTTPPGMSNSVAIAAGGFFNLALQSNGTIVAWGDNSYGQTNVPSSVTNAMAVAAGQYHGLALLSNGCVKSWGAYSDGSNFYSVTNYSGIAGPPASNVMAIAAGFGHDLALMSNGTVVSWGLTNIYPTCSNSLAFQTNLSSIKAIACGWDHNVALLSNGVVEAWGLNASSLNWNLTNVPANLTNAVAISAFGLHSMALREDGTVEAWGYSPNGETNVPAGLSNVVAIAAGGLQSIALQANGTLSIWGAFPLTNVPAGVVATKVIAGGFEHNLILQSDLLTPIIIENPMDQYAPAGSNITFTVEAESLAQMTYQWQFNGTNLTGKTNSSMTITNVQATNVGDYDVIVSTSGGSIQSATATFTLVTAPVIATGFTAPTNIWFDSQLTLNINVYAAGQIKYPVGYQWSLNGIIISTNPEPYPVPDVPTAEGTYSLAITNIAGSNSVSWNLRLALPGMVEAWGDDAYGECDRPATSTNVAAIAAGQYHSLAVTDDGNVLQWGKYSDGTNFYSVGSPPSLTNLIAVAASLGHDLGLTALGVVTNWGLTNDAANYIPTNLPAAKALAAGWYHNVALLTNGSVVAWGNSTSGQTNVPADLTNANSATAIAAGELFSLALRTNGTVEGWGDNTYGQTNIPSNLTNVVAIAAGNNHALALQANGNVTAWGLDTSGQTSVPSTVSNVMAIAAGAAHSVALVNDGTLVEWGNNTNNQSLVPAELSSIQIVPVGAPPAPPVNLPQPLPVKLIAAGGNHTMAAIFSPLVQYPVDVSKDLMLICSVEKIHGC